MLKLQQTHEEGNAEIHSRNDFSLTITQQVNCGEFTHIIILNVIVTEYCFFVCVWNANAFKQRYFNKTLWNYVGTFYVDFFWTCDCDKLELRMEREEWVVPAFLILIRHVSEMVTVQRSRLIWQGQLGNIHLNR